MWDVVKQIATMLFGGTLFAIVLITCMMVVGTYASWLFGVLH